MSGDALEIEERLRRAVEGLPDGLRAHIRRVEEESLWLAERYEVDEQRARVAALGHDLVRHLKGDELLAMASKYGLTPDDVERASPIIVHGPVAAQILIQDYDFDDHEIIEGIDCHTTARAGMARVEKVLFIADKVEPHKIDREPALESVRSAARESLDAGVLRFLDLNIEKSLKRRWLLHPRTLEARNDLLRRLGSDEARDTKIVE